MINKEGKEYPDTEMLDHRLCLPGPLNKQGTKRVLRLKQASKQLSEAQALDGDPAVAQRQWDSRTSLVSGSSPGEVSVSPVLGTLLQARRYKPPELSKLPHVLIHRQLRLTGQVQCFCQPDSGQSMFMATLTTLPQMTPCPLS